MKQKIKEGLFYDDPTRKSASEIDNVLAMSEAFSMLTGGINRMEELTRSFTIDDNLREEIRQATLKIVNELKHLHPILNEYIQNHGKSEDITPVTRKDKLFQPRQQIEPININESTYSKIDQTIKRIIEVNKKLNHGTKSK